jgi:hypothetical protein
MMAFIRIKVIEQINLMMDLFVRIHLLGSKSSKWAIDAI